MSGHSHFSSIKHKKAITDAKRGKIFSKLSRLISIAAKEKGPNPEDNPKLRMAVEKARGANMPKNNIEKAIKKGSGQLEGVQMEEFIYEAYGPAGIALIIEGITDNKNRATAEVRHILSRFDGKLAQVGSVKYLFDKKGEEWVPRYPVEITEEKIKKQIERLFEMLDENDDIQEIYSNLK
ncbi:MAG: YebC/PmpR family DNA-binding transcriptional regulator [Candidatus Portnoybacteria bacterium]